MTQPNENDETKIRGMLRAYDPIATSHGEYVGTVADAVRSLHGLISTTIAMRDEVPLSPGGLAAWLLLARLSEHLSSDLVDVLQFLSDVERGESE